MLTTAYGVLAFSQDNPKGLQLNDLAPDFSAKNQMGKVVSLKSMLSEKKSIVLVFYRGEWCPYCNKALSSLEDSLKLITAKGAALVAISPEKPENISKTIEKTKASYSILYDEGLKIMKSYNVAFQVDSLTVIQYKTYGVDFSAANGEINGANLPVPAVYVINKDGRIVYRHFDPDYRKRASINEIIKSLDQF